MSVSVRLNITRGEERKKDSDRTDHLYSCPLMFPSIFLITYLQAHHLDLEFYDCFYEPGAYLRTHAEHMKKWHTDSESRVKGH